MRLGLFTTVCTLTLSMTTHAWAMPKMYQQAAIANGVEPNKLYAIALANAGVTTQFGHYLPWPWSVTVDGRYYRFKTRVELFQYLIHQMGKGKQITYGVAGIPLTIQAPEKIWDSLDVNYNINYVSHRLQQFTCHNLSACVADYRAGRIEPKVRIPQSARSQRPKHQGNNHLSQIIARVSREQNVDRALLHAIIARESAYKVFAKSRVGAMGLMQLMPGTAEYLGLSRSEYYDPYKNVTAGAKYIKEQLANFGGRLDLALAAYNAGPGNVRKHKGIPPFLETRQYVPVVMGYYRYYKARMD